MFVIVSALPHTSVSDTSFYKHIDADLPEYQRARQLLIWCAYRSMTPSPSTTSSILHTPKTPRRQVEEASTVNTSSSLPELTPEEAIFLRELQEEAIRMLAEGNIDTSVSSHKDDDQQCEMEEKKTWWKPNEQNVRNRKREVEFRECVTK
jgi:kinetochore protein Mis13/DSN1